MKLPLLQFSHFFSSTVLDVLILLFLSLSCRFWNLAFLQRSPADPRAGAEGGGKEQESKTWHLLINSASSLLLLLALRVSEVWDKVIFRWKDRLPPSPSFLTHSLSHCLSLCRAGSLYLLRAVCTSSLSSCLSSSPSRVWALCCCSIHSPRLSASPSLPLSLYSSWMFRHGNCGWKALN